MKTNFTPEQLAEAQFNLEMEMKSAGMARFEATNQRAIDQGDASSTMWNRRIISEMTGPMAEVIVAFLEEYKGKRGKPSKTLTYLRLLEPKVAAYVAIKVTLDSLAKQATLLQTALAIGSRIEDQVRFSRLHEAAPRYIEKVAESLKKSNTRSYNHGHVKMTVAEGSLVEDGTVSRWADWPKPDKVQLGSRLIGWLVDYVTFEGEPIVELVKTKRAKAQETSLEPSVKMQQWVDQFKDVVGEMSPAYAPCVIPPKDWTGPFKGGFHVPEIASTLPMVKSRRDHVKRLTRKQMPVVYEALNALQAVRWQINDEVFSVAQSIQELGAGYGMPQAEPYQSEPFPFDTELTGKALRESLNPEDLAKLEQWKAKRVETITKERKRKASLLEVARVMQQARKYQPYEAIHYVYTLDFRGRVYAQGTDVSPQGGDIGKAMIRFADGMELGADGAYWLAVHGANVWGEDKISFDERVQWVETNEDDICDYAADPLTFTGWTEADKPWQFLAWCKEWARLVEHVDSGLTRETFISHLPVAMDGSCSGIQHYSAMLKDAVGGAAVNLVPDSAPHDIYGDVAVVAREMLAEAIIKATRQTGIDEEEKALARVYERLLVQSDSGKHLVDRNCCKKPVMTLPYGSTQITCLKSVFEYLADKGAWAGLSTDQEAAKALSPVVWNAIGRVVQAAREGMSFIRKIAKEAGQANSGMEWVTPTGFIVEQKEYEVSLRKVDTQLMGRTQIRLQEETDDICPRRMQSAAAPNFVHSMDASHLVLAVAAFKRAGINSIAVIHDSFGTHAGATAKLRMLLSGAFVDMYETNDVLTDLLVGMEFYLGKELDIERPLDGTLDLSEVMDSAYCFA